MKRMRSILAVAAACVLLALGCQEREKPYGSETLQFLPGTRAQTWAVAPAVNLSGEPGVDPLLQADDVFGQLQQVRGLTVIPVNRVAEVYASLKIEKVQSEEQAALVCDLLGCDALLVPTVTVYDPFYPPKLGASLQLFRRPKGYSRAQQVNPRDLARSAAPAANDSLPDKSKFLQAVGMYDAANGSTRQRVMDYATGRNDPKGPLGPKEYLESMDRYCGFVYHDLIENLLSKMHFDS